MIAYFASDLLWATRIKSLAQDIGVHARPVRDLAMLRERATDSPLRGLVVDLAHADRELALSMIREARVLPSLPESKCSGPVRIIAFGPHVETQLLAASHDAGADSVMTRGAFDSRMAEVLHWADGGDEPSAGPQPST